MIKLKRILEATGGQLPNPSLGEYILQHRVVSISDWLYHGTPLEGLKEMLTSGIYGTQHGEVAEYDAFSTSLNSEMLSMFSEGAGDTGLQFKVENANVVILDDILTYLVTQLPGSGMDAEVDDEEKFEKFIEQFNVPVGTYKNVPYLPYNYLSSLGIDAFMYDYVWLRIKRGLSPSVRDESEICFIGNGIEKLNKSITSIWVDGQEYEPEEKAMALQDIEDRICSSSKNY